jgi:ribokinase
MTKTDSPDIVVVGSSNIDLLSKIPRLPKTGETIIGESFHLGFGGKGANQAVMASMLGAKVGMVTKVGDDVFGKMTIENYKRLGIACDFIFTTREMSSGVAPILVESSGKNMIVVIPGANLLLNSDEVKSASHWIKQAKIIISQLEISDEPIIEAFQLANSSGVTTILNPAPARKLPKELISLTNILVPNETEAELLTGIEVSGKNGAEEAANRLLSQGVGHVILTLGEDGAYLFDHENNKHFPALKVDAVDSTGAGDAFIGCLAFHLAQGNDLISSIQFANIGAALSVTKVGTQISFPSLAEIEKTQSAQSDKM